MCGKIHTYIPTSYLLFLELHIFFKDTSNWNLNPYAPCNLSCLRIILCKSYRLLTEFKEENVWLYKLLSFAPHSHKDKKGWWIFKDISTCLCDTILCTHSESQFLTSCSSYIILQLPVISVRNFISTTG